MTLKKGDRVKYAEMPTEGTGEVIECSEGKLVVRFPFQGDVEVDQTQTPLILVPKPRRGGENYIDKDFLAIIISSVLSAIVGYFMGGGRILLPIMVGILIGIISGIIVRKIHEWQNPRG
jgi:predicted transcriptional regulator